MADMPPVMILCGGQGTRLRDVSELLPKPMVPIGPQPILWHIMKCYAAFGVRRFVLCLGYKRETIQDYFLNYHARATDVTVRLGPKGGITFHGHHNEEDWEVTLADTGEKTLTAGRVCRALRHLPGEPEIMLTYGDGVADIDVAALLAHHRNVRLPLTVTAVHPAGRFGEISVADGKVAGFHEKPQTEQGLINGGFMVMGRDFIDRYLDGGDVMLEDEPMQRCARAGMMSAYVHPGFWQCMDTAREHQLLNRLWESGHAPWTRHWPST